jgi:hypothetical protein
MTDTKIISKELVDNAYTYKEYKDLIERLISEKKTTGPEQSESRSEYTKANFEKMVRIESAMILRNDLADDHLACSDRSMVRRYRKCKSGFCQDFGVE